MTKHVQGAYGEVIGPMTLRIQRHLPGPIERVCAYLTDSDLRRPWLASGAMELKVGAPFEFVWRNSELTTPPGDRPEGFGNEHRMECRIVEVDPPRRLVITWGRSDGVDFELTPAGDRVLLTLTHRRLPDRDTMLNVSAGWHAHLDILVARATGADAGIFWDNWRALKADYTQRLPA